MAEGRCYEYNSRSQGFKKIDSYSKDAVKARLVDQQARLVADQIGDGCKTIAARAKRMMKKNMAGKHA